jgi:hypothetical protein
MVGGTGGDNDRDGARKDDSRGRSNTWPAYGQVVHASACFQPSTATATTGRDWRPARARARTTHNLGTFCFCFGEHTSNPTPRPSVIRVRSDVLPRAVAGVHTVLSPMHPWWWDATIFPPPRSLVDETNPKDDIVSFVMRIEGREGRTDAHPHMFVRQFLLACDDATHEMVLRGRIRRWLSLSLLLMQTRGHRVEKVMDCQCRRMRMRSVSAGCDGRCQERREGLCRGRHGDRGRRTVIRPTWE